MVKAYLVYVVVVLFCLLVNVNSALIEVGNADLSFIKGSSIELLGSGISPSISIAEINTTPTPPKILLDISPVKDATAVKLVHVVQSDKNAVWNPANYYFSLNSELQKGQFVEFLVQEKIFVDENVFKKKLVCWIDPETRKEICKEKVIRESKRTYFKSSRPVRWLVGDRNSVALGSDFNLVGNKLFFNSIQRDFSNEILKGFNPVSLSIDGNLVSLKFKTDKAPTGGTIVLNDLVTKTTGICQGKQNVTFFDGNTYFLNGDGNFSVNDCNLTLEGGTIIKFKNGSFNRIEVENGGLIKISPKPNKKISITSIDDNTFGELIGSSDGVPNTNNYWAGIRYNADGLAKVTSDANELYDLNISYAQTGLIWLNQSGYFNAVRNNRFFKTTTGVTWGKPLNLFSENVFLDGNNTGGGSVGLLKYQAITEFSKNLFTDCNNGASVITGTGAINIFSDNNFFNSLSVSVPMGGQIVNFSNNKFSDYTHSAFSLNSASPTTNFSDNNFSNFDTRLTGEHIVYSKYDILNMFDNRFENLKLGGAMLFVDAFGDVNFFNNKVSNVTDTTTDLILVYSYYDLGENTCTPANLVTYNNTFSNIYSSRVIFADTTADMPPPSLQCGYYYGKNNIFANVENVSPEACDYFDGLNVEKQAYWNATPYFSGVNNIILSQNPFLSDNSDRNFLLNAYGLAEDNNGVSVGSDLFFNQKTLNPSNALDRGIRGVGFHYDQNAPYVKILSPNNGGVFNKTVTIDFNIESGYGTKAILQTALFYSSLDKLSLYSFVNQPLSLFDCNGLTLYFTCSYVWNTLGVDGNVFLALWSQDTNGIGKTFNDRNIQILNVQTQAGTKRFFSSGDNRVNQQFGVLNEVSYSAQGSVKFPLDATDTENRFFSVGDYRVLLPTKELLTGIGIMLGIIILVGVGVWWYREK